MEKLEVVASFDWLKNEETVGMLGYDNLRGSDVFSFEFTKEWLRNHPDILIGKDLVSNHHDACHYQHHGAGVLCLLRGVLSLRVWRCIHGINSSAYTYRLHPVRQPVRNAQSEG